MPETDDPFAARDPEGPAHQFHRAGFGADPMKGAADDLVTHLAEVFTQRRETWTDVIVALGFEDHEHDGHRDTAPKATAMMGNHAGTWGVNWNFGSDTFRALLDEMTRQRSETDSEWNVLAVRLSRPAADGEQISTQVRGFPVADPVAFLRDEDELRTMLGGMYPYYRG